MFRALSSILSALRLQQQAGASVHGAPGLLHDQPGRGNHPGRRVELAVPDGAAAAAAVRMEENIAAGLDKS